MSFEKSYVLLSVLVATTGVLALFGSWLARRGWVGIQLSRLGLLHFAFLGAGLVAFGGLSLFPSEGFISPVPQVFEPAAFVVQTQLKEGLTLSAADIFGIRRPDNWADWSLWIVLLFSVAMLRAGWLAFGCWKASSLLKREYSFKELGRLRLVFSEKYKTPYSISLMGCSYVSLPVELLNDRKSLRIVLKHELQHIRSRDSLKTFALEGLKTFFFLNPIVWIWAKAIARDQEISCDHSLIERQGVDRKKYASCLLEVASRFKNPERIPAGAAGILSGKPCSDLLRRIEMLKNRQRKTGMASLLALVMASSLAIGGMTFTLKSVASPLPLNLESVQALVKKSDFSQSFPVVVNKRVLHQLNRMCNDRQEFRDRLDNMKRHERSVRQALKKYRLPEELLAIPLVESGYINHPLQKNPLRAAGIWQFIRGTALAYNLRVDRQKDERLDIGASTDAAMRYLSSLNLRFQDWHLAVLSYNGGEGRVQRAITKSKSRDAWVLDRIGVGDKNYLPKVVAAAILIKYPSLLD